MNYCCNLNIWLLIIWLIFLIITVETENRFKPILISLFCVYTLYIWFKTRPIKSLRKFCERYITKEEISEQEEEDDSLLVPYLARYAGLYPGRAYRGFCHGERCCRGERFMNIDPKNGKEINIQQFLSATSLDVAKESYHAISYKHDIKFKEKRDENKHRPLINSPMCRKEIGINLIKVGAQAFWHDGVKAFWEEGDRFRCEGLYAYLLDQASVLVCLPSPTRGRLDPGEWCPDRFPLARNALLEGIGRIEVNDDIGIFARQNIFCSCFQPRQPSLAWGSFNAVWMLAESFCGCLTGRISLTDRSLDAARNFIAEVKFAQRLIKSYLKALRRTDCCAFRAKMKVPPYWTVERCSRAIGELELLADEVRGYLLIVLNPEEADPFKLSQVFLEKIPHASFSQKSDQLMVGAICSYMLQRVAGQGSSPSQALRDMVKHPDPLSFCLLVASEGQYGFGGGTSYAQKIGAVLRALLRDHEHQWTREELRGLWDLWPQPVYGPGFSGSATTSVWKEVFWCALQEGRCLGWEAEDEDAAFAALIEEVLKPGKKEREDKTRQYLVSRNTGMRQNACLAMEKLEEAKANIRAPEVPVSCPHGEQYDRRQGWIKHLREAWFKSQASLKLMVGDGLPIVFDKENGLFLVYMLESLDLGGHTLEAVKGDYTNVWVVGGSEGTQTFQVNLDKHGNMTGMKAKNTDNDSGSLVVVLQCGQFVTLSLEKYPLYQMAFAIRPDAVHLVLRRRIWAKTKHVQVPLCHEVFQELSDLEIHPGGAHFENPYTLDDDDVFTIGLSRGSMADYTHTYPSIVRSASLARKDPCLAEMWEKIVTCQWTEPGERSSFPPNIRHPPNQKPVKKSKKNSKSKKSRSNPKPGRSNSKSKLHPVEIEQTSEESLESVEIEETSKESLEETEVFDDEQPSF